MTRSTETELPPEADGAGRVTKITTPALLIPEYARLLPLSDAATAPAQHRGAMPQLPRPARRTILVAHVTVSVGWLGISLCLLTLAIAGARDPAAFAEPAYRAMKLFADWLLPPVALLTLGTGLLLSLGSPWGLARHRWIYVKFWLSLAAIALTAFSFRPGVTEAAERVAAGEYVQATDLLIPPAVSLSLYVFLTAVSVLKPWGLTRRGRRLRAPARPGGGRKPMAASPPRQPA